MKSEEQLMKQIAIEMLRQDTVNCIQKIKNTNIYIELNKNKVNSLANSILRLPEKLRFLFYGYYVFKLSYDDITDLYGIKDPYNTLVYNRFFWSSIYGCEENELISESCFAQATQIAINKDRFEPENTDGIIKSKIRDITKFVSQIAATAFIVFTLGFTTVVVVNAEVREQFVNLVYEIFEEFGIFKVTENEESYCLSEYVVGYIPNEYELSEIITQTELMVYEYINGNDFINIVFASSGTIANLDTENAEITDVKINGNEVTIINQVDGIRLVYEFNGNLITISGTISKEEIVKIAENIK